MGYIGHIDPAQQRKDMNLALRNQATGGFADNLVRGLIEQQKVKAGIEDITRINAWDDYQTQLSSAENLRQQLMGMSPEQRQAYSGPAPNFPAAMDRPQPTSEAGMNFLAQRLARNQMTPYQAASLNQRGRITPYQQARLDQGQEKIDIERRKPTETDKLKAEGYTPEEIRRIRDIKHGIEPRKSSRNTYERMSTTEKAKYLSTEQGKAEGRYYGIEGGNTEPLQPEYHKWILKEKKKVQEQLMGEKPKPAAYPEAEWSEKHGMWTIERDGRILGVK